jgi:dihydroxyacid dehydratase/phosphogluconate dehydratase
MEDLMTTGNYRSKTITQGASCSPNRAMLRAVGFDDADFDKPIVGIANAHSTITPRNMGLGALVPRIERALAQAGAKGQVFGTITIADDCPTVTGQSIAEVLCDVPEAPPVGQEVTT